MLEKYKFKKKYPYLAEYITDKRLMKELLANNSFGQYYLDNVNKLKEFLTNLKLIYDDNKALEIFIGHFDPLNYERIKKSSTNLKSCIMTVKSYDDDSLEVLKDVDFIVIENMEFVDILDFVLELVFQKYYQEPAVIKGYDASDLFKMERNLETRKRLLMLAKNHNLDFFAFVVEKLSKYNIDVNDLNGMLKEEVNDKLFASETQDILGEIDFTRLLIYYFKSSSISDKKVINELLTANNYDLIRDILHLRDNYKFSRNVKENEYNCSLFELSELTPVQIINIICNYISPKVRLNADYFFNLKNSVNDDTIWENFCQKHSASLDLLVSLDYNNFIRLGKVQQKKLYDYVKNLDDDKRKLLVDEIQEINKEMEELYKAAFTKKFNESENIINKSQDHLIRDRAGNNHQVKVYELKDEEPFSFLITVMHKSGRLHTQNMYGRPAHKLTIDEPSNFCRDLNGGSEVISTSMIDQRFIETFVGNNPDIMYVFGDIENDDILSLSFEDGIYPPQIDETRPLFYTSSPMGPDELMRKSIINRDYNEITIRRKKKDGTRVLPKAILCFDTINDVSIKHAEYFDIPIIVINTKTYKALAHFTDSKKENVGYHL